MSGADAASLASGVSPGACSEWAVTGSNRRPPGCKDGAGRFDRFRLAADRLDLRGFTEVEFRLVSPDG
jgi:hypothetical protein